jgi:Putative endonuclease segE, GIY-YIG domain
MPYNNPWTYRGKLFESEDINEYYGFIYRITNTVNGYDYVGRKYFKTIKKRPPLKGKKNKRRETVETDWKDYWGSSARLVEDMTKLGKDKFTREIIHLCKSRGETNYMEAYYQFKEGVLLKENNYNGIIQIKLGKGSVKDLVIKE